MCCCKGEGALLVSLRGDSTADCGHSPGFRTCGRSQAAPLSPTAGFWCFPGAVALAVPGPRTRSPLRPTRAALLLPGLEPAALASAAGSARRWLLTFAWEQSLPYQSVSTSCKRTWRSIVCKALSRTAGKIQRQGEDPIRRKKEGAGAGWGKPRRREAQDPSLGATVPSPVAP